MVIPGGMSLIGPTLPARRPNIVFYPFDRRSGGHTFLLERILGWPPEAAVEGISPDAQSFQAGYVRCGGEE